MDSFQAWKYQNIPRPSPLPQRLDKAPFYGGAGGIGTEFRRAPLYYLLGFSIIKGLKIDGILNQLYLIRIFSLILFLLSIYFTYLSARIVFQDNPLYTLATVSFVALLPQFLIISTSINPINLAVLLETIVLYLILLSLNKGKKWLAVLLGPVVIGLGFSNHAAALFMIPPFLILILVYLIESLENKRILLRHSIILSIITISFLTVYLVASHLFPAFIDSITKTRISEINRFVKYFSIPSSVSPARFFDGLFMSFWYFSGWMRFRYPVNVYSLLKLISLFSFFGLLRYLYLTLSRKRYETFINFKSFLVLGAACLSILLGVSIRYLSVEIAQGRFVFPAISALAILFVFGLKEICPQRSEKWLPILIIIGFLILDVYTVFTHLIRVFYYFTNA